jgi:hypothetical protein
VKFIGVIFSYNGNTMGYKRKKMGILVNSGGIGIGYLSYNMRSLLFGWRIRYYLWLQILPFEVDR